MAPSAMFGIPMTRATTILLAVGVLVLAAVPVQVTRTGIDLYALLFAGVLLLVVERTVGDWVANLVGPVGTALLFAVVAAGGVAYLLSDGGRKRVEGSMMVASAYGYHPVYFVPDRATHPDDDSPPPERAARRPPPDTHVTSPPPAAPSAPAVRDKPPMTPQSPPIDGARQVPFSFARAPRELATARLIAEPELAQLGDEIVVRLMVAGVPKRMPQTVTFFVNGLTLSREAVEPDGTAEVRWRPRVPGQYQLRAEISASSLDLSAFNTTVHVLPRAR